MSVQKTKKKSSKSKNLKNSSIKIINNEQAKVKVGDVKLVENKLKAKKATVASVAKQTLPTEVELPQVQSEDIAEFKDHKDYSFLILGLLGSVLFLFLIGFAGWKIFGKSGNLPEPVVNNVLTNSTVTENKNYGLLNGEEVISDYQETVPLAVMVENQVDARPQAGLSKASIVYEALAEGGITRFLAIFDGNKNVDKIGLVRSARPYYIIWAGEYQALYAHSGGSAEALNALKAKWYPVQDLNEFYNGNSFWRLNSRSAPHNLYTSTERLRSAVVSDEWLASNFEPWKFQDEPLDKKTPTVSEVQFLFSPDVRYQSTWKYDASLNQYIRWQGTKQQFDEDGSSVTAKNILVQYLPMQVIDKEGRHKVTTTGTGKALLFKDGKVFTGTWKKNEADSRTVFYDDSNQQFVLNRGTTWVEVVPDDGEIVKY
jgi:hypothetical protein